MEQYAGFEDISPDNDQGVLKKIINEGVGEAMPINGAKVFVHYVGTFSGGEKDGEKFDSSRDREDKFSFTLGEGQVIKAWDIGVATMKKNEVCELICKPSYAYGDKATGSIPANSTLKFEIELFDWKGKDISPGKDGSIIQTIVNQGIGYESPKECVPVKISIKGTFDNVSFDERDVDFEIGDAASFGLIQGIEIACKKMKKCEKSIFEISANYAFGNIGKSEWNIPPNATVTYEIHMKDFEKVKESFSLDTTKEKLDHASEFKTRATEKLQNGNVTYATKLYERSISYIEYDSEFNDEEKVLRNNLLLSLRLNLALCYLKSSDCVKTIEECDKALELDPASEKALYRKGQALIMKSDYEEAKSMFGKILLNNPSNSQAQNQIKICLAKIKEHLNIEKKLYQSMFSKVGKGDTADKDKNEPVKLAENSTAH
uniref:peptidylprolyl isomerase n=1 Tax=Schmidtea mediterranea TaxID=79327 RepID=I1ZI73_SCHMD|nr:peptidyl prolyl cis trans isomerase FKBP-1 [Schmidtea mediterranea]